MPVYYPEESRKQTLASIRRYFDEVLDQDIGDLKAELVLDYVLKEIAPTVYNQAIQDALKFVQDRVGDMDSSLFAAEFAYWEKPGRKK
jgi:uncharacterized protein (DUF2164 family)